eukprot:15461464-Alexandrium_andersonii.AAC.1
MIRLFRDCIDRRASAQQGDHVPAHQPGVGGQLVAARVLRNRGPPVLRKIVQASQLPFSPGATVALGPLMLEVTTKIRARSAAALAATLATRRADAGRAWHAA